LISENLREWNKDAWGNILRPLMKAVPDFDEVWKELVVTLQKNF
jgi:hypothetical protein